MPALLIPLVALIQTVVICQLSCKQLCHFPGPAFSSPSIWCVVFRPCFFQSLSFVGPSFSGAANSAPPWWQLPQWMVLLLVGANGWDGAKIKFGGPACPSGTTKHATHYQ